MAKFSFDPELCTKCYACVVACRQWHEIPIDKPAYREITEVEEGTFPQVTRRFATRARKGCDLCQSAGGNPRCALTCPTAALRYE